MIHLGDNLEFMRTLDDASVDLIYADPPFNTGRDFVTSAGAFTDKWAAPDKGDPLIDFIHEIAGGDMAGYIAFMKPRLIEMKRILKPTGSIYLHCDPTASHYLKLIMDAIFGRKAYVNEIIWHYYNGTSNVKRAFVRKHDTVLFYAMDPDCNTFNEDEAREPYEKNSNFVKNPGSFKGGYKPNPLGKRMHTVWRIPTINNMSKERTGYPTQKPLALLERIIKASSNEGDLVFDPFAGGGTTLVAAKSLLRRFIGCDVSDKAVDIAASRVAE